MPACPLTTSSQPARTGAACTQQADCQAMLYYCTLYFVMFASAVPGQLFAAAGSACSAETVCVVTPQSLPYVVPCCTFKCGSSCGLCNACVTWCFVRQYGCFEQQYSCVPPISEPSRVTHRQGHCQRKWQLHYSEIFESPVLTFRACTEGYGTPRLGLVIKTLLRRPAQDLGSPVSAVRRCLLVA